jgi:hypothetical protein
MPRLAEKYKIVPLLEPQDHQAGVLTFDSINLKNYSWCSIIITFGELTGDEALSIHSGATSGADSADVYFDYAYTGADLKTTGGDIITVKSDGTPVATLAVVAATFEDRMLILEIDPATLTDGYFWITVNTDGASTEALWSAVAILTPKYAPADAHSAIV